MLCVYGCGMQGIKQFKNGSWCCSVKGNLGCPAIRSQQVKSRNGKYAKPVAVETAALCSYGCKQVAKFIFKNKRFCCSVNQSLCPVIVNKIKEHHTQDNGSGQSLASDWNKKTVKTKRTTWIDGQRYVDIITQKTIDTKKSTILENGNNILQNTGQKSLQTKISTFDETCLSIFERSAKTYKQYKHSNLFTRSQEEYNFLKNLELKYKSVDMLEQIVKRGPSIPYWDSTNKKYRTYISDFLIDNTLYEIKSHRTWFEYSGKNLEQINKDKLNAALTAGYEVILVLDGIEMHWPVTVLGGQKYRRYFRLET